MRCLKTNTDLPCILLKNTLICYNNKTGGVCPVAVYVLFQDLKTEAFCRECAGYGCLCAVPFICHFFRGNSRIFQRNLFPVLMLPQKKLALGKTLLMRIDCLDIGKLRSRKSKQTMLTADNLFPYDIVFKLNQKIIHIIDTACRGIFNGQNRIIG